jgi:nicotinamide-nucleotide amidase
MITPNSFKLFGVQEKSISEFMVNEGIDYTFRNDGIDCFVSLDFSSLTQQEQDVKIKKFLATFAKHVYAESDITLQEQLVKIATIRGLKISVAESFTGGGISSEITSVSGASKAFYEGIVAYSCEAKSNRLFIDPNVIEEYKPVSAEVACGMVKGLLLNDKCDLAISTTGIAGPNSDDSNFPVGLCYIGVGSKFKTNVFKHKFKGTRAEIVKFGIKTALFHAVMALRSGSFDI